MFPSVSNAHRHRTAVFPARADRRRRKNRKMYSLIASSLIDDDPDNNKPPEVRAFAGPVIRTGERVAKIFRETTFTVSVFRIVLQPQTLHVSRPTSSRPFQRLRSTTWRFSKIILGEQRLLWTLLSLVAVSLNAVFCGPAAERVFALPAPGRRMNTDEVRFRPGY